MSKKLKIPKGDKGRGYVGVWASPVNTLGWMMPSHLGTKRNPGTLDADLKKWATGERFYLCEISVKPVLDKKGRPITRIVK